MIERKIQAGQATYVKTRDAIDKQLDNYNQKMPLSCQKQYFD